MIAYIKGELVETLPGSVILDVHGIGYRIYISGRESEQLTKMGSQVKLHTYFHVKEDAMQLIVNLQILTSLLICIMSRQTAK